MTYRLFVDDERFPSTAILGDDLVVVSSYQEAKTCLIERGCPSVIYFDHDLGCDENGNPLKSGLDIVKWMINRDLMARCLESPTPWIPDNFVFFVHSQNPVGKKAITDYLNSYLEYRKNESHLAQ